MQKGEESVGDLAEWRQRKEVKRVEIMEQGNLLNRCHNLAQTIRGIEESDGFSTMPVRYAGRLKRLHDQRKKLAEMINMRRLLDLLPGWVQPYFSSQ